jgi:hypothetical protein
VAHHKPYLRKALLAYFWAGEKGKRVIRAIGVFRVTKAKSK